MAFLEPCSAMLEAGIEDPESQSGIDFCTDSCPYDYCVMEEKRIQNRPRDIQSQLRRSKAITLNKQGKTTTEIANILGITKRTVNAYLRRNRNGTTN